MPVVGLDVINFMIRLAGRHNFREVEQEWQWEFVFYVLSSLGIPDELLEECVPEEGGFEDIKANHKIRLRKHMDTFDVTIVDDKDGGIRIYVYNDEQHIMVAEWKKCKFIYKEDLNALDPAKKVYIEVHGDTWTIFDDGAEQESNE